MNLRSEDLEARLHCLSLGLTLMAEGTCTRVQDKAGSRSEEAGGRWDRVTALVGEGQVRGPQVWPSWRSIRDSQDGARQTYEMPMGQLDKV
jgi:hypothetical protein